MDDTETTIDNFLIEEIKRAFATGSTAIALGWLERPHHNLSLKKPYDVVRDGEKGLRKVLKILDRIYETRYGFPPKYALTTAISMGHPPP